MKNIFLEPTIFVVGSSFLCFSKGLESWYQLHQNGAIIMNKQSPKTRKATFTLEPDGFSIHTIELSQQLTGIEFRKLKSELFPIVGNMYEESKGHYRCRYYEHHGVRLFLHRFNKEETALYFLQLIVNPRKLVDADSSYLGIFPPKKSSIYHLEEAFAGLFQDTPLDNDINNYALSRVDFCTNIHCDNTSIFRETVRVLRKLPTPPKYTRVFREEKDKKKEKLYNKHYITFKCGTHSLVIYDKIHQLKHKKTWTGPGPDKVEGGVLRFEVACNREYLRKYRKKHGLKEVTSLELLWHIMGKSRSYIIKHFQQCFDDVRFVHFETAMEKISHSRYSNDIKDQQMRLVKELQRKQSMDTGVKKLKLTKKEEKKLLDSFESLGFSPIPLGEKFKGEFLYGPVSLLKMIGEEDVTVEYH